MGNREDWELQTFFDGIAGNFTSSQRDFDCFGGVFTISVRFNGRAPRILVGKFQQIRISDVFIWRVSDTGQIEQVFTGPVTTVLDADL